MPRFALMVPSTELRRLYVDAPSSHEVELLIMRGVEQYQLREDPCPTNTPMEVLEVSEADCPDVDLTLGEDGVVLSCRKGLEVLQDDGISLGDVAQVWYEVQVTVGVRGRPGRARSVEKFVHGLVQSDAVVGINLDDADPDLMSVAGANVRFGETLVKRIEEDSR